MALNVIYKNRNGTTAEWAASTYILEKGELGVDTTLNIAKIGDGVNLWKNLPFLTGDLSKYVTTDTEQTISSLKSFSQGINVNGVNDKFGNNLITVGSNGILVGSSVGGDNSALILCGKAPKPKYSTDGGTTSVELALISDIPSIPTNYVTTDTAQTITGGKTFNEATHFETGISIGNSTVGDYLDLTVDNDTHTGIINFASESVVGCTLTLPDGSGTIATLEDISVKYVTIDTAQAISGIKTFTEGLKVDSIKTTNNVVLLSTNSIATQVNNSSRRLLLCGNEARPKYSLNSGNTATEIALLSDIPTNYVTTDTEQTISGVKTFTGDIKLQGVGIAAKVGGENSSYTNILKGSGNVVEIGSTSYLTRIYSNGRISVYDYSTSPSTSEKVAYQSEIPTNYVTTDTEQTISGSKIFKDNFTVSSSSANSNITLNSDSIDIYNVDIPKQLSIGVDSIKSRSMYSQGGTQILKFQTENMSTEDTATLTLPTKSGTIALTSDISGVDSDSLLSMIEGGNGIAIAKNAAGDKVEVKVAAPLSLTSPSNGPVISITNNNTPTPAISIDVTSQYGPPTSSGLVVKNGTNYVKVGGREIGVGSDSSSKEIRITETDVVCMNSATGDYDYFLRQGNVKTVNGQSIYGSGDITISGGGKTYYRHLIKMGAELFVSLTESIAVKFEIIDTRSTAYTSVQEIIQAHPSYKTLCAGGRIDSAGEKVDTFAVYAEFPATYGSNKINFYSAADMWGSSPTFSVTSNFIDLAVTDTLTAL